MFKISLIFSINLFISYASLSCSCYPISVKDNYNQSKLVLKGKVIMLDTLEQYYQELPKGAFRELHLATVIVEKIYKGNKIFDTIKVVTGNGYGDCGYEFTVGTEYLIYAVEKDFKIIDSAILPNLDLVISDKRLLYTDVCLRTTSEIGLEIKKLKKYLKKRNND